MNISLVPSDIPEILLAEQWTEYLLQVHVYAPFSLKKPIRVGVFSSHSCNVRTRRTYTSRDSHSGRRLTSAHWRCSSQPLCIFTYIYCIGYKNSPEFSIFCKCTLYCIGDLNFIRFLINCSLSLHSDEALSLFCIFQAGGRVAIGLCAIFPLPGALYKTFHGNIIWGSYWGDDNHSGSFSD